MPGKERAGQIIEASGAGLAQVPLPCGLGVVTALLAHDRTVTCGTAHPIGPS